MPVHVYTLKFWEKITFYHFSKKRLFSVFLHIEAQLSQKNAWLPPAFFLDFNSPWYDLLLSLIVVIWEKILPISGTALKNTWVPIKYCLWDKYICFEVIELIVSNAKGLSAQWGKTLISHCFTVRVSNQLGLGDLLNRSITPELFDTKSYCKSIVLIIKCKNLSVVNVTGTDLG